MKRPLPSAICAIYELPEPNRGPTFLHAVLDPFRKQQVEKGLRIIRTAETLMARQGDVPVEVLNEVHHRIAAACVLVLPSYVHLDI